MITTLASLISVLLALIAAALWAASAAVNLPVIGSAYGTIANLEPFYAAMKKVARLNKLSRYVPFSRRKHVPRSTLPPHRPKGSTAIAVVIPTQDEAEKLFGISSK